MTRPLIPYPIRWVCYQQETNQTIRLSESAASRSPLKLTSNPAMQVARLERRKDDPVGFAGCLEPEKASLLWSEG